VINRSDLAGRAEIIRAKGTDRAAFLRGDVDRYTWVDTGSSYVLSDLLAAFLLAQLEHAESIIDRRRTLWERYRSELTDWVTEVGVRFQHVPEDVDHSGHVFAIVAGSAGDRTDLLDHLATHGVNATFHYVPLQSSPVGRILDPDAECPETEQLSSRLLRLPLFAGMTDDEQSYVIDTVRAWPS
jgi:dTDP-4-amino-4,6-dideoxygalactose transaminase